MLEKIFSDWDTFSTNHHIVIYGDGIARETMHFVAGLLGDQQVLLLVLMVLIDVQLTYVTYRA